MKKVIKNMFIICVILVLSACAVLLCACNSYDNSRNPRKGEPESGMTYTLQTAYDNGWISKGDLQNIAYYNNVPLYDPFGDTIKKGFKPRPKSPETIDEETKSTIIRDYVKTLNNREQADSEGLKKPNYDWLIDDLQGVKYYGTYEGLVAVLLYTGMNIKIFETTIGGVKFVHSGSYFDGIILWKE